MKNEIQPSASPEETAAISAAISLFQAQTASPPAEQSAEMNPWLKAAYVDGVSAKDSFGPAPFFGEL